MTDLSEGNTFLTGWLPGVFIKTAAPIVAITTVNGLFTVVDACFLGAYVGPDALSAVSLIFPGLMLLVALQSLVSNGMASILARRLGAGNRDGARRVFASAHALALAVTLILNLVYWTVGRQVIDAGAAGNTTVAHSAMLFMGALIACAPVSFFLSLHLDGLRCEGKIGFMTLVTLSASLLNILANWLFMAVMHGVCSIRQPAPSRRNSSVSQPCSPIAGAGRRHSGLPPGWLLPNGTASSPSARR